MPVLPGVLRVDATYQLGDGGRLVADLPIRKVLVGDEGPLYSHLGRLVTSSDHEIVAAASRYGPLGPVAPLAIRDRPGFLLDATRQMTKILDAIPQLRKWIAHGGSTPIRGRLALAAHTLAAYAEADPSTSAWILDVLTDDDRRPDGADRSRFIAACGVQEQLCLTAFTPRIPKLLDELAHPDWLTFVRPTPSAERYLALAARLFPLLATRADELGPASAYIRPDRLGSLGTELAPYLPHGNLLPEESVNAWRIAARMLAAWTWLALHRSLLTPRQRRELRDGLAAQLQRTDAWPLVADHTLGAYPRALWSVWPIFGDSAIPRACSAPGCSTLLPSTAGGNRRYCDDHIRQANMERAARNRARHKADPAPGSVHVS